jgi:ferredoxin
VAGEGANGRFTVTLRNRGNCEIEVYGDESILEAAEDQGEVLPYGCRYGGCITCAAKLISGEVDQSEGVALKPDQLAEGYVLLCVARPKSDCTLDVGVESHDKLYRNPFKNPGTTPDAASALNE